MVQGLRALVALAEAQVQCTAPTWLLTTIHTPRYKGFNRHILSCMQIKHSYTENKNKP